MAEITEEQQRKVDKIIARAKAAQEKFASYTQEQVYIAVTSLMHLVCYF